MIPFNDRRSSSLRSIDVVHERMRTGVATGVHSVLESSDMMLLYGCGAEIFPPVSACGPFP